MAVLTRAKVGTICPELILYTKESRIHHVSACGCLKEIGLVLKVLAKLIHNKCTQQTVAPLSCVPLHMSVALCLCVCVCVCVWLLGEFVRQHVSACFCFCICNGIKVCNSSWMIAPLFISKCRPRTEMLWITAFLNMRSGVTDHVNGCKERWH